MPESVIIHRTFDPIQAEMLGDLLREAGIQAQVIGTRNASLIGVGTNVMELHIRVPHEQAGPATDFLEEFFRGDGAELLEKEGLLSGDEGEALERVGPRQRLIASSRGALLAFTIGVGMVGLFRFLAWLFRSAT